MAERFSITLPASRKAFILELLRGFSYVKVEKEEEIAISKNQQKLIVKRIESAKESDYISLVEFKKRIKNGKR